MRRRGGRHLRAARVLNLLILQIGGGGCDVVLLSHSVGVIGRNLELLLLLIRLVLKMLLLKSMSLWYLRRGGRIRGTRYELSLLRVRCLR